MLSLSSSENERFLRALEEDREFRYAVMGLLGFTEILERINRIKERFARLEWELLELWKRRERLEERFARLEEQFLEIKRRQNSLERKMEELRRMVDVAAHRSGAISEEAFREAMRSVVEEALGVARMQRWVYRDKKGFVYGHLLGPWGRRTGPGTVSRPRAV